MKKQSRYFILAICLLGSFSLHAQMLSPRLDSLNQKLTTSLADYYKRNPREKIFIHTDQNVYLSGQTIWYKTYALAYGKPSELSGIVYVRLSDANGKLIKQDKLPVKKSTAYGNINLPDSLHSGWYYLQALTAWMLNFSGDGFYQQKIYIKNIHDSNNDNATVPVPTIYHFNLYPEGGDLVDGNLCNIAFKVTGQNGMPVSIYGEVLDNDKRPVAKLATIHDGMGSFELDARANIAYTARVHFPDGSVQNVALPAVKKTGIVLRVNPLPPDELEVRIINSGQRQERQDVIVTAVQNNGLSVIYPLELSRGINVFSFKKSSFSSGVLRLTVFDESWLPRAERVVYVNKDDQLKLSLSKDTLSYNPRSKNAFTLNLKDSKNRPVKANLSVSVTDASIGSEPDDNICSYFLMSSELKGYIHHPAYYFKNNCDTLQQQLDLVMLTNGWRHFRWDTLLNDKPKQLKYLPERSQFIAGRVENYHDKDNLRLKLMISNADSTKNIAMVEPDSSGLFILKDYEHQGTAKMYYEVVNRKNRAQSIKVDFLKTAVDTADMGISALDTMAETQPMISQTFLDSARVEQNAILISKGINLKTVTIKEHKLTPTEQLIESHVKHLAPDHAYTLDMVNEHVPSMRFFDYIGGKFPGLQVIVKFQGGVTFIYQGQQDRYGDTAQPMFYLDEVKVSLEDLEFMSLNDIAMIRFAPPPVWFAPLNGGFLGAIMVYTKNFEDDKNSNKTYSRGFNRYTFEGYSVTREFSSPDYSVPQKKPLPDYRSALYWNHDLNTDSHGNTRIKFCNSDRAKKYRVIVQAMDKDGKIGYLSEVF